MKLASNMTLIMCGVLRDLGTEDDKILDMRTHCCTYTSYHNCNHMEIKNQFLNWPHYLCDATVLHLRLYKRTTVPSCLTLSAAALACCATLTFIL